MLGRLQPHKDRQIERLEEGSSRDLRRPNLRALSKLRR